jgi:hypothetical protein
MVLDCTPQPFDVTVNAAVLEAMMVAASSSPLGTLTNDDLLDMVVAAGLEPRVLYPNGYRRRSRFAFVIHPLSQSHFTKVEPLRHDREALAGHGDGRHREGHGLRPPLMYSRVTGVQSPTGDEAEGWLITVGGTPKELMAHSPEFTYARLLAAADQAKKLGAQVMGLGAFTKVVGDAGVTVAKQAPLPITTGNSYSASGALWAAHEALERLGLPSRRRTGASRARPWSWEPPAPSARCAPGCWRWPATTCTSSRRRQRSCSPSRASSSGRTRGPRSTSRPRPGSSCPRWT